MAMKGPSLWATYLSLLVLLLIAQSRAASATLPTLAVLKPRLENAQATLAIATSTSARTATATATLTLSSSTPFTTPGVSLRAVDSRNCWYPDGSIARDFNYTADPSVTSGDAPCCDISLGDIFLPGGLCWFPGSTPQNGAYIYRAACTDRTFKSDRCAKVCKNNTPNRWESILFCPKTGTFCCQQSVDSGSCCDDPDGDLAVEVPKFPDSIMSSISEAAAEETAGPGTETNTLESPPTPTSSPTSMTTSQGLTPPPPTTLSTSVTSASSFISTPTSSNDPSPPPPSPTSGPSKDGLSTENKITLGLGIALGVPTLLATIYMCFRYPANVKRGVEHLFNPVAHGLEHYIVNPVAGWWAPSSKDGGKAEAHEMD